MNFNNTKHDAVIADKQHNLELDSVYIIVSDCMGVFARVDELLYMKYKKKYCWKVFIFLRKKIAHITAYRCLAKNCCPTVGRQPTSSPSTRSSHPTATH